MKYILRIIALPFVIGLLVVHCTYHILYRSCLWVKWGGQVDTYDESLNRKTISDVFIELKRQQDAI